MRDTDGRSSRPELAGPAKQPGGSLTWWWATSSSSHSGRHRKKQRSRTSACAWQTERREERSPRVTPRPTRLVSSPDGLLLQVCVQVHLLHFLLLHRITPCNSRPKQRSASHPFTAWTLRHCSGRERGNSASWRRPRAPQAFLCQRTEHHLQPGPGLPPTLQDRKACWFQAPHACSDCLLMHRTS